MSKSSSADDELANPTFEYLHISPNSVGDRKGSPPKKNIR